MLGKPVWCKAMDANVTANLRAMARDATNTKAVPMNLTDDKKAKAKAKAKLNREIGKRNSVLKASLKLFAHVFIISTALLVTDWVFNNGLQTQLIYRGSNSGGLVTVLKNKAYHVNAFVKSKTAF